MLALTGYANRLSVIAGQSIRFHVSNHSGQALEAGLVRVVCADPNPDIGGVRYEACELPVLELSTPGPQSVPLGSYARLGPADLLKGIRSFTLCFHLQARLHSSETQVICSTIDDDLNGIQFELSPQGQLVLQLASQNESQFFRFDETLQRHCWYRCKLVIDALSGTFTWQLRDLSHADGKSMLQTHPVLGSFVGSSAALSIASASSQLPRQCFNGRIEDPWLIAEALPLTAN